MTTVYLSVSGPFSAGTQGALPLSRDRLLTIEWGVNKAIPSRGARNHVAMGHLPPGPPSVVFLGP